MEPIRLTADLAAVGYSWDEVRRMTRSAELVRVRRGAYATALGEDRLARFQQLVQASARQCGPGAVVSHVSAAVLHGLPVWNERLEVVELTRDRSGGGRVRRYVRVHGFPLDDTDIVELDGLLVTSIARTVLDLACSRPLEQVVPVGDAALRRGVSAEQLDQVLVAARRRHGVAAARRAIGLLDGRAESPGESLSRVVFHRHGLPTPQLQLVVVDRDGRLVGRCDFGWEESRTLGEFDGRIKYGRALQPRQDIEEVLFDEKRREDALRDLDWQVVRWTWADLQQPAALIERLKRAFARGRRSPG